MPNLKFKNVNVRMLESKEGDLLLVDLKTGVDTMLAQEFMDMAKDDDQKALMLGKRFLDFVEKHREARWREVKKELEALRKINNDFVTKLTRAYCDGTISDLRNIERAIYFFKLRPHPQFEN